MALTHPGPTAPPAAPGEGAASAEAAARAPHQPREMPMLTLFGLLVVWACLVIVLTANRLSEPYFHAGLSNLSSRANPVLASLDPQSKILLPFSMFVPGTTRANALKTFCAYVNFNIDQPSLDKLANDSHNFRFDNEPIYRVVHLLVNNPNLGVVLRSNRMTLYQQQLELKIPGVNARRELTWQARLPLTAERSLVVPSGDIDLWLAFQLVGDLNQESRNWNTVQVEVHRGPNLLTMTRALLDDKGNAVISLSDVQTISLSIQRLPPASEKAPFRYDLNLHYTALQ